jgi:hypothetical protein
MRVRLLSPYPLIVGADGRPIDPPNVVELPDDFARALEAQSLLEAAPDEPVTAEATVLGLPEPAAVAPDSREPPALETLTKAELVALAEAELGLDLDIEDKKAALVAAIEAARAAKEKA